MKAIVMAMLFGFMLPDIAQSEIYRCQTRAGDVFQNTACTRSGTVVDVQINQPSATEVVRIQKRLSETRKFMHAATKERAKSAEKSARESAAEKYARESAAKKAEERLAASQQRARDDRKTKGPDRRNLGACPLGLSSCKKVAGRVFRRPKSPDLD